MRVKAPRAPSVAASPASPAGGLRLYLYVTAGLTGAAVMIVEILGAGAQFVMPPSTHPSGVVYRMSTGDIPPVADLPILLQEHVDALLAVIAPYRKAAPLFGISPRPRKPVGELAPSGDFFADVNTLACKISPHGFRRYSAPPPSRARAPSRAIACRRRRWAATSKKT